MAGSLERPERAAGIAAGSLTLLACVVLLSCAPARPAGPASAPTSTVGPALSPAELYSESHGAGPPVLLLHGYGASTYSWRYLVGPLATRHRVILLDLKGFGRSPKPLDGAYSVHDQAALVTRFIVERDLTDLTLIGHSFGGSVALATAVALRDAAPRRLAALVLIGSPAYRQALPWFIQVPRIPVLGPLGLSLLPARWQARAVLKLAYHDDRKISEDAVAAYAAPIGTREGRHALVATARQIVPPDLDDLVARYPTLTLPTLILWGAHDEVVPLATGRRLREALPDSRLVVLESSGHIPQEEVPEDALDAILTFLATPRA